ncbi:MAG: dicarboxylate/amino acid:cation symporter [Opitutales bacterium]|jgi:Na+/H+-dicarboxylate symporter
MNPLKWKFHWQVLFAILLAICIASFLSLAGMKESTGALYLVNFCDFIGELFMRALKMIIVPLVATSIISGMLSLGDDRNFGRIGGRVLVYYATTGLMAILVGLFFVNVIAPGHVTQEVARQIVGQAGSGAQIVASIEGRGAGDLLDFFQRMIPTNIFEAASNNGRLLGLIVFCLLFGFFISKLSPATRDFQDKLWGSLQEVMMKLTQWVIAFAPIGVFGLILPVILRTGFGLIVPLALFFTTVMLGLCFHMFITLSLLLWRVGRVNPFTHLRTMIPVLLTAFSSSSSSATLPVTMETVEKDAGVSNRISSFTLPLGATVNMDGTALYECVVVIFVAQFYGVLQGFEIGLVTQFKVVLLALLTSVGVAGIPSASLVAIALILGYVGLPVEAIGLVWVTDRILDMCRTSVNVYSDTCGAVIIGRLEGEKGIYSDASAEG